MEEAVSIFQSVVGAEQRPQKKTTPGIKLKPRQQFKPVTGNG